MATIARTAKAGGGTNFNSGQTIDPDEVNTDFNTIVTEVNGNVVVLDHDATLKAPSGWYDRKNGERQRRRDVGTAPKYAVPMTHK